MTSCSQVFKGFQHGGSLRFVWKIIFHFPFIRSISTLIIGSMEGKSQDTAGEPEKGDCTKPQAPTERKVSVG